MKTSDYPSTLDALKAAMDLSIAEDRIVTVWCDDTTLDDALDELPALPDSDYEWLEHDDCIDVWSMTETPDWRLRLRQSHSYRP